jgi:hypothetical protein
LINAERYRNHEERKITFFTCKQQNITKTKSITNAKPWHPQHLMMINYPLLWHFPSFQNATTLHPLGHIFIQVPT